MVVNSLFLSYSGIMNIKELAKKLGLSITTVSRALGGYSDVSEKTRERVKKLVKKRHDAAIMFQSLWRKRCHDLDLFFSHYRQRSYG